MLGDIPAELQSADEFLTRYGRWATAKQRHRRCVSAEGRYRAEPAQATSAAVSRGTLSAPFPLVDALDVQRSLAAVPERLRSILVIVYIPRRLPLTVLLRQQRIGADECRKRLLAGLAEFSSTLAYMRAQHKRAPHRGACGDAKAPI